jgi:tRNA-2-methylthio-N6-dimethylallyladenosine synthase
MPGALPESVIEERHRRLLDVINEIGRRRYEAMVGKIVPILVEGISRRNESRYEGRTRCNKIVVFSGAPRHVGQVIPVRVQRVGTFTLYADPSVVGIDEVEEVKLATGASGAETLLGPIKLAEVGELNR